MNNSAKGNMYEVTLTEMRELFAPYLAGNATGLVCVASLLPLEQEAKDALNNSFAALGYGRGSCTFISVQPDEENAELDAQALFLLTEGLDPLCLVIADKETCSLFEAAYRATITLDGPCRLLGRSAVAFRSFASLLIEAKNKQKAWALLKTLPKFGEH